MQKSKKINDIINKYGNKLNLHEIKAKTGAGNGYSTNSKNISDTISNNPSTKTYTHKSHKINDILLNSIKSYNLHEIKMQTGAGNGYRY